MLINGKGISLPVVCFRISWLSEFLAVAGRYSALCSGTYMHNTVPPGGWKPKSLPPFMLYKIPKV